jgi:predicted DCC family thiol-disulfide oxidoreductase YuxK
MPQTDLLFYDGHCGLCHRAVRFVLRRDRSGTAFRFAPLFGETFQKRVPASVRAGLPDSMVIQTEDGRLLIRSDAWIYMLRRLALQWKLLAGMMAAVPRPLRDAVYNFVATNRQRFFKRPDGVCPVLSPELRRRFDP